MCGFQFIFIRLLIILALTAFVDICNCLPTAGGINSKSSDDHFSGVAEIQTTEKSARFLPILDEDEFDHGKELETASAVSNEAVQRRYGQQLDGRIVHFQNHRKSFVSAWWHDKQLKDSIYCREWERFRIEIAPASDDSHQSSPSPDEADEISCYLFSESQPGYLKADPESGRVVIVDSDPGRDGIFRLKFNSDTNQVSIMSRYGYVSTCREGTVSCHSSNDVVGPCETYQLMIDEPKTRRPCRIVSVAWPRMYLSAKDCKIRDENGQYDCCILQSTVGDDEKLEIHQFHNRPKEVFSIYCPSKNRYFANYGQHDLCNFRRECADADCDFEFILTGYNQNSIRCVRNDRHVCARPGPTDGWFTWDSDNPSLVCNRIMKGPWEQFVIVDGHEDEDN